MRRKQNTSHGYDKPFFEYYTSDVGAQESDFNGAGSVEEIGYKHGFSDVPQNEMKRYLTSPSASKSTPTAPLQSNNSPWSSETLTSHEKKHYKKALKEIYDTVKICTRRLETESDISGEDVSKTSPDTQSAQAASSSLKPQTGREESHVKARKKTLNKVDVQEIYRELHTISQKLKDETRELHAWEEDLREREMMLNDAENIVATKEELVCETLEEELERRCSRLDQEYQDHLSELQKALLEKTKEANRLRDSFNTIRSAYEELRKQFLGIQDQNKLLEAQSLSLQQRLNNLLRRNEYQAKQREGNKLVKNDENVPLNMKRNNSDLMKTSGHLKFNASGILDVLANLLIWVSDGQLDCTTVAPAEDKQLEKQLLSKELIHGKCVKILPPLADLLSSLPAINPNVMYPLLKFVYSVILYIEKIPQGTQKPVLTSTFRRIGEELYEPEIIKQPDVLSFDGKKEKRKAKIYLRSSNLDERMLSSLIVLKTVSRADYLSRAFDILKSDLKGEEGKRLFILHNGLHAVIPLMNPRNKSVLECAVDVILQMSMESGVVSDFLLCCSTSDFFNVCTNLLQEKGLELRILEKLSIILQRLSKLRSNRRYFEAFQLVPHLQELLRQHDSDNAFLALNLRSALVNLNVAKNL